MYRKTIILFLALFTFNLYSQELDVKGPTKSWEKLLQPGLNYRMEIYEGKNPLVVHALRFSQSAPNLELRPIMAHKEFYPISHNKKCECLSKIVAKEKAIAGINADFFPFNNTPIGAMVKNNILLSKPYPNRSVFGWSKKAVRITNLTWSAKLIPEGRSPINIDGFNEECKQNQIVLFTKSSGRAVAKPMNVYAAIKLNNNRLAPSGRWEGKYVGLFIDTPSVIIPDGHIILAAKGAPGAKLSSLKTGQKVTIEMKTTGFDWDRIKNAVGGGPLLVSDGVIQIASRKERFRKDVYQSRTSRTAIGYTDSGEIWLVSVDHKRPFSSGATLKELAQVMLNLKCKNAMNLDGGSSCSQNVHGISINNQRGDKESPIANALLVFGQNPTHSAQYKLQISGPSIFSMGTTAQFRITDTQGKKIHDSLVFWACKGDVFIDQSGVARAVKPGEGKIMAYALGKQMEIPVLVTEKEPIVQTEKPTAPIMESKKVEEKVALDDSDSEHELPSKQPEAEEEIVL